MDKPHKALEVWKQSLSLTISIYQITETFPSQELYGLTNQIRRAAVSVPSNIAKGAARQTKKEFINFLHIAQGSLSELDTQLDIAFRLEYLTDEVREDLDKQMTQIDKMITGLIIIEWRSAEGKLDRLPALAAELVHLKVDVIVSAGSTATRPAKEATSTIPIVMTNEGDPVGTGFVASLARPGGNVTGHRAEIVELAAKSRLPVMYRLQEDVKAGGLMIYGVNLLDLDRRAAIYVDNILRGAKPADLPIEQPTRFEFVINFKGGQTDRSHHSSERPGESG